MRMSLCKVHYRSRYRRNITLNTERLIMMKISNQVKTPDHLQVTLGIGDVVYYLHLI